MHMCETIFQIQHLLKGLSLVVQANFVQHSFALLKITLSKGAGFWIRGGLLSHTRGPLESHAGAS
jgi:hypothetical protein